MNGPLGVLVPSKARKVKDRLSKSGYSICNTRTNFGPPVPFSKWTDPPRLDLVAEDLVVASQFRVVIH